MVPPPDALRAKAKSRRCTQADRREVEALFASPRGTISRLPTSGRAKTCRLMWAKGREAQNMSETGEGERAPPTVDP
jgi:hypothetical protein